MTTPANPDDPLAEFSVGASMDGEVYLDHYPATGRCYWESEVTVLNGTTLPELVELARAHLAERHAGMPATVDPRCTAEYEGWTCEREREHHGRHTAGDGGRANGATWLRDYERPRQAGAE